MKRTALILGSNGRFGGHMACALDAQGWSVRRFRRGHDRLPEAAAGVDLIVNGWNTKYHQWGQNIPAQTQEIIAAAKLSGAAVMLAGNIYVYGEDQPGTIAQNTPHRAKNQLGKMRREMEKAYHISGVKTVILRCGDFVDTVASGNWFDLVIAARAAKGKITYPGALDRTHSWAYLPDVAQLGAGLAGRLEALPQVSDILFESFAVTGSELGDAVGRVLGKPMRIKRMNWLPIQAARPFWPEARHLIEMRYLWNRAHRLQTQSLADLAPRFVRTEFETALAKALRPLVPRADQKRISTQINRWSEA